MGTSELFTLVIALVGAVGGLYGGIGQLRIQRGELMAKATEAAAKMMDRYEVRIQDLENEIVELRKGYEARILELESLVKKYEKRVDELERRPTPTRRKI